MFVVGVGDCCWWCVDNRKEKKKVRTKNSFLVWNPLRIRSSSVLLLLVRRESKRERGYLWVEDWEKEGEERSFGADSKAYSHTSRSYISFSVKLRFFQKERGK